jgi:hypothetical protein
MPRYAGQVSIVNIATSRRRAGHGIEAADVPTMTQERFHSPFVYFAQI